jgi:hypothetical protein
MTSLAESMRRSLQEPGSAAAQVPLVVEVRQSSPNAFKLIKFDSELNKEVTELARKAIGRVAGGLNLPREVLEGMGDSNHWSAWQVAEETYRTHLLPALDAIADGPHLRVLLPDAAPRGIDDVGLVHAGVRRVDDHLSAGSVGARDRASRPWADHPGGCIDHAVGAGRVRAVR